MIISPRDIDVLTPPQLLECVRHANRQAKQARVRRG